MLTKVTEGQIGSTLSPTFTRYIIYTRMKYAISGYLHLILAFHYVLIYIYKHIYMYVCICNIVILKHMFLSVKRQLGSFLLPGKLPSLQGLKTGAKTRKHTEKTHIHRDLSADQPLPQQGKAHVPHLAPDRLAFWLFTGSRERKKERETAFVHLRSFTCVS